MPSPPRKPLTRCNTKPQHYKQNWQGSLHIQRWGITVPRILQGFNNLPWLLSLVTRRWRRAFNLLRRIARWNHTSWDRLWGWIQISWWEWKYSLLGNNGTKVRSWAHPTLWVQQRSQTNVSSDKRWETLQNVHKRSWCEDTWAVESSPWTAI